jgi:hypothetical protein
LKKECTSLKYYVEQRHDGTIKFEQVFFAKIFMNMGSENRFDGSVQTQRHALPGDFSVLRGGNQSRGV